MKLVASLASVLLLLVVVAQAAAQESSLIKEGSQAPEFSALADTGKEWKSSDYVGKQVVVVYFYPADMTGGCTKQACGFRDDKEALVKAGVEVVGVSGDTVANHVLFKKAENLNFTLLADPQGKVAEAFGVPQEKVEKSITKEIDGVQHTLTRGTTIKRFTVVIGKNGKVAKVYEVKNAGGDSDNILELVKSL